MPPPTVETPTVISIARSVGVAACTVSSVLNGQAQSRRIRAETARRIMEEAERLNYVPNGLARGLRSSRTYTIGVLVADFTNEWTERLMAGIEPVFNDRSYFPLILVHHMDARREERELNLLAQRRVDGVITVPLPGNEPMYESFLNRRVPVVFVADTLATMPHVSFAAWDSESAAAAAMQHLLEIGRRRIAILNTPWATVINARRVLACERVLDAAGITVKSSWHGDIVGQDDVLPFLNKVFAAAGPKPDAIYCNNDGVAFAAVKALWTLGVKVPEQVAVVGMGDLPRGDESGVGLTSMHEPIEEIGRLAAETVLQLIDNPKHRRMQHLVPGVDLKVRRTTVGVR